jgi:hypothetical protein
MRFRASGRLRLAAVAVGVVGLAAGGIAYATIPDSSGVIHACYKKNQGTLRVIDTDRGQACLPSEKALDWSQSGPAGPEGWDTGNLTGRVPTDGSQIQLSPGAELELPAGTYFTSGSVTWRGVPSGTAELFCTVTAVGADVTGSTLGGSGTATSVGGDTIAMTGAVTVNSGTAEFGIACSFESGTAGVPVIGRLHVLRLATLNGEGL